MLLVFFYYCFSFHVTNIDLKLKFDLFNYKFGSSSQEFINFTLKVATYLTCKIFYISFIGNMLCDPVSPLKSVTRIKARIVLFNVEIPITKGFMVMYNLL